MIPSRDVGKLRAPLSSVDNPALKLIPDVMERIDLPWLHLRKGQLHLRLVPLTDLDAFPLQATSQKILAGLGKAERVVLSYQDYNEYQKWKERLAPPDQVRPPGLF